MTYPQAMTRTELEKRINADLGPVDLKPTGVAPGFWWHDRDPSAAAAILQNTLQGVRVECDRRRVFVFLVAR